MLDFLSQYHNYFIYIGIASILLLILTIILTPYLICLIPSNYFTNNYNPKKHSILYIILLNSIGLILLLLGFIMLFTPGQGLITILFAIFIMRFPYKRKLELQLIKNDILFNTLNWIRAKFYKDTFIKDN